MMYKRKKKKVNKKNMCERKNGLRIISCGVIKIWKVGEKIVKKEFFLKGKIFAIKLKLDPLKKKKKKIGNLLKAEFF